MQSKNVHGILPGMYWFSGEDALRYVNIQRYDVSSVTDSQELTRPLPQFPKSGFFPMPALPPLPFGGAVIVSAVLRIFYQGIIFYILLLLIVLISAGAKVDSVIASIIDTELIVLTGQDGIHSDANQRSDSQAGEADGCSTDGEAYCAGCIVVLNTDGKYQDASYHVPDNHRAGICGSR